MAKSKTPSYVLTLRLKTEIGFDTVDYFHFGHAFLERLFSPHQPNPLG